MKITIIIQTEPCEYQDWGTAYQVAIAALQKGHEVRLFLLDESVIAAQKTMKMVGARQVNKMIKDLADRKVKIVTCGACCLFRGITSEMLVQGAEMGGLTDLAELIQWADRILNLGH
jgi:tRNA 2-thiouridine synthesizing protein D